MASRAPLFVLLGNCRWIARLTIASVLLLSLLALPASASDLLFNAPFLAFGTGSVPLGIAIGDMNSDGKLDLVVANNYDNTVSVLLGKGDGRFEPKRDFGTGYAPAAVAVADLNADGKLDVVVANNGDLEYGSPDGSTSVLLGNGDGTLQTRTDYATGHSFSVAIGLLNGDTTPDLAVAHGPGVSVWIGNGNGTFVPGGDYGTASYRIAVAIGDLNGDTKADLVTANTGGPNGSISMFLGDGSGVFASSTDVPTLGTMNPSMVALGDLNGDHKVDLVTRSDTLGGAVAVLLGNGNGTFAPKVAYAAGYPQAVAIGDVSGDGKPDLVVARGLRQLTVLLGNGNGTFGPGSSDWTAAGSSSVAIGDLNGDGKPDLASNASDADVVCVLPGNGNGTFGPQCTYATGDQPVSVAIADLSRDGKPDLVVADQFSRQVSVLLGVGSGTFGAKIDFSTGGNYPTSLAISDLNADGKLDVVVATDPGPSPGGTAYVMMGNGNGSLTAFSEIPIGDHPKFVTIQDLNNDSKPDLALADGPAQAGEGNVSVLIGNGNGTFAPKTDYPSGGNPVALAIGDLDRDGKPDLAAGGYVRLGNGNGTFGSRTSAFASGSSMAMADLDRDGRLDLALVASTVIPTYLGNGDGTLTLKQAYTTYTRTWDALAIGDLNGDGIPDLAVVGYLADAITVLLGNGDGTFGRRIDYGTATGPQAVAIGDLNQDGRLDLAVACYSSDVVTVLLNQGTLLSVPSPPLSALRSLELLPAEPNPSHAVTQLRFRLPAATRVEADLFDGAGRRVRRLSSNATLQAGERALEWDGRDGGGAPAPDGLYFARIHAGGQVATEKFVHLR